MTGAARVTFAWPPPAPPRARQLAFAAASWIVAANILTGGPLLALWVGSQTQAGGTPSMTSVGVVLVVLATVNYGLVALLRGIARARDRFGAVDLHAIATSRFAARRPSVAEATREPLVLIDGDTGAARPWRSVAPHLEFGFDVLAGVLPRDGSIDGTLRAMDRIGWQTAHVVARPRDARAAVDLARLGRARSLLILDSDSATDDSAGVATEIAELAAFRSPR
jgi:hypothetical protein